jgi:hypothetical protein
MSVISSFPAIYQDNRQNLFDLAALPVIICRNDPMWFWDARKFVSEDLDNTVTDSTDFPVASWRTSLLGKNSTHALAIQGTSGSRPILRKSGRRSWLEFNGTSHTLQTPQLNLSTTRGVTVVAGIRKRSDASWGIVAEFGPNINTTRGSFALYSPWNNGEPNFAATSASSVGSSIAIAASPSTGPNTLPSPLDIVLTLRANITEDSLILRGNSTQIASNSSTSMGTSSGFFGNLVLNIGSRNGSSNFASINLFSLLVVGKALSNREITVLERFTRNIMAP